MATAGHIWTCANLLTVRPPAAALVHALAHPSHSLRYCLQAVTATLRRSPRRAAHGVRDSPRRIYATAHLSDKGQARASTLAAIQSALVRGIDV